jgi:hypothetical protein
VVVAAVVASGCSTTQDKAAALRAKGADLARKQQVLSIAKPNPAVKVLKSTVLHDQNGTAVVIELRNMSNKPLVNLPMLVDVRDAAGKSIYKNNLAGLDADLDHVAVLAAGKTFDWVNDQIQPSGVPKSVVATVGTQTETPPAKLPNVVVTHPHVHNDVSGPTADGNATNHSQVPQARLVVFGVARKGGRVIAAGRAVVLSVPAGKTVPYHILFIGNPLGAQTSVAAPPTVLK